MGCIVERVPYNAYFLSHKEAVRRSSGSLPVMTCLTRSDAGREKDRGLGGGAADTILAIHRSKDYALVHKAHVYMLVMDIELFCCLSPVPTAGFLDIRRMAYWMRIVRLGIKFQSHALLYGTAAEFNL